MSISTRFKRFFLARRTVLLLFSLLLVSIVAGTVFPQRFRTLPEEMALWQADYPMLARFSALLALDRVFTSFWFAFILILFFLSLLVSTFEQVRLAYRRTFSQASKKSGKDFVVPRSKDEVLVTVRKKGYLLVNQQGNSLRCIKHPWGYWGNCLLHLGILLVIVASIFIVLTRQKGIINLAETELFQPGATWGLKETGLAAGSFYLSDALKVDSVQPQFWENDELKQLNATISFLLPQGQKSSHKIEVNSPVYYEGVRINLSRYYGRSFLLAWREKSGQEKYLRMDMLHPNKPDQATYKTFDFEEIPYSVQAKYYADAARRTMNSDNPQLGLRLVHADEIVGELYLEKGQSGIIGPYQVHLVSTKWWIGLDCANVQGIVFVFLGFFIIILGVGLTYFMPPREILVHAGDEECVVSWYPGRFADFYTSELEDIVQSGESSDH